MGHSVGVLCDNLAQDALTEARLEELKEHLGLGLHRIAMSREIGWRDVGAIRAARHLARSLAIDVLHGHGAKGGASARLAGDFGRATRNRPAALRFYTPHGGSLHYDPRTIKGAVFMTLERQLAGLTDGLVFESAFAQDRYIEKVGASPCAMRVIANGVRDEEFAVHAPAPDATDIIFIGELRLLKGVDVLLDAIARLAPARLVSATIVGDGPDGALFRNKASELGLADRVAFTGAMPAQAAFPKGRIMVVPSRAESLPYVVLEAAARAIPLIASNVGGIPEIVHGSDTRLVPAEDIDALAEAIGRTLAAPETATVRALQLQAIVGHRFTVQTMANSVVTFYRDVNDARTVSARRA